MDRLYLNAHVAKWDDRKLDHVGIGMIAVVAPRDVYRVHDLLRDAGHDSVDICEVVEGEGRVLLKV